MLSNQANPLEHVDLDGFYISHVDPALVGDNESVDEITLARKNRELKHLRKMQTKNFVERAAIRVVELFSKKDVAC